MGFLSNVIKGVAVGAIAGPTAGFSTFSAGEANDARKEAAQTQTNFQADMSNTAYQRAMKDMKAAGLNPILAYQQGGASTPSGAMPNLSDPVASGMATGTAYSQMQSNVEKQSEETKNIKETRNRIKQEILNLKSARNLTDEQADQVAQLALKTMEETRLAFNQTRNVQANTKLTTENIKSVQYENVQREVMAKFYESAEFAKVAQSFGINAQLLKTILTSLFSKGRR